MRSGRLELLGRDKGVRVLQCRTTFYHCEQEQGEMAKCQTTSYHFPTAVPADRPQAFNLTADLLQKVTDLLTNVG